jgi:AraC-like DNA-binding protein
MHARSWVPERIRTAPPHEVISVDVLSQVLRAVRLTGALYFEVSAAHPWVTVTPSMKQIGATMMPSAEHVIPFHVILFGRCWAMPQDRSVEPSEVEAGDIVMFPFGESHVVTSDRNRWEGKASELSFYAKAAASEAPFTLITVGGDGQKAKFVCGYLGCDASPFNPVLGALPKMLVVKGQVGDNNGLMQQLLRAALDEKTNRKAGAETVLARLSELMFVQAIRQHMDSLPASSKSWLSGLRDEHIGKALQIIHTQPAACWTIASLARESGLSRSVFAERFTRFTGEAPMHYVGRWRMQLAARLLATGASIGAAAQEVGYNSEAAFQRAFKKYVGVPPGEWRRKSKEVH